MIFEKHLELAGSHAFLSASSNAWTNYDDDKIATSYRNRQLTQRGTDLHNFASQAIKLGVKLPNTKKTINAFVNDCIGYRMESEQILFHSYNAFGTVDAISFKKNVLRIFDLKTGVNPTSMRQLEVYTAYFCLQYGYPPHEIQIELRIYQNDEVKLYVPSAEDIHSLMERIVTADAIIEQLKEEARQ